MAEVKDNVVSTSQAVLRKASLHDDDFASGRIQAEAKDASALEHNISVWQSVKLYKKAIAWSILLSTAIIMEGYDTLLLSNFYALPAFVDRFGNQVSKKGVHTVSAPWYVMSC